MIGGLVGFFVAPTIFIAAKMFGIPSEIAFVVIVLWPSSLLMLGFAGITPLPTLIVALLISSFANGIIYFIFTAVLVSAYRILGGQSSRNQ